jgi:DNA modification methylase
MQTRASPALSTRPVGRFRVMTGQERDRPLAPWFGNASRVLQPGRGFCICGGYANCANHQPFLKRHKTYFNQAVIWSRMHPVLTRKDRMGRRVTRAGFAWERGLLASS